MRTVSVPASIPGVGMVIRTKDESGLWEDLGADRNEGEGPGKGQVWVQDLASALEKEEDPIRPA